MPDISTAAVRSAYVSQLITTLTSQKIPWDYSKNAPKDSRINYTGVVLPLWKNILDLKKRWAAWSGATGDDLSIFTIIFSGSDVLATVLKFEKEAQDLCDKWQKATYTKVSGCTALAPPGPSLTESVTSALSTAADKSTSLLKWGGLLVGAYFGGKALITWSEARRIRLTRQDSTQKAKEGSR